MENRAGRTSKYKLINSDDCTNEHKAGQNLKWSYIPDHPYRILITAGPGSQKTNALLNLINDYPDIDQKYLYAKDPYEGKYKHLINKREKVGLNNYIDPKLLLIIQMICRTFIKY